jgi:hypothetical protein
VADIADDLAAEFLRLDYRWKIGGTLVTPTAEDIRQTLDRAKQALYTEPVPSQMEVGRLIVRHWKQNNFDVYLQIGSLT